MKSAFDRRRFIAGSAGALSMTLLKSLWAATPAPVNAVPSPPVARVEPVTDAYFGEKVVDRYRWMENPKDPEWLTYLRGQNDYARAVLDGLPMRSALFKRIEQLSGDAVATRRVERAGAFAFYEQRPLNADNYKLFVRDGLTGVTRVLVDPTGLSSAKSHFSLDWWRASPDGKYVVYGLSKDGSEDSLLHILTTLDGNELREQIPNTEQAQPRWLDDSSGFFYTQLTGAVGTPERYLDAQARFHKIGTEPNSDPTLMKRGFDPTISYEKIQAPVILTYPGASQAVLVLYDVRPEYRAYVAPLDDVLANRAKWTEVCGFEDEVTDIEIRGDDLYMIANKGTPRGRVMKTSANAPNLAAAVQAVPQGKIVIQSLARARDGIYMQLMDGGISRLQRLQFDGQVNEVAMPFEGTIGAVFAEPSKDGVLISLAGWLQPSAIYAVDHAGKLADTGINPKPKIDVSAYETKRLFATARDGTMIPYIILYRKGMKQDGSNPTWISAYGSYGSAAYTPAFASRTLALVDAGAVVGYAYVRGGGEYGREWHKAGQLENKPNTWRDLIAVCEDLIAKRYTSTPHLAIGGRSAGGITVGRAMTERPDLFAAVIDGVGWSNPLRYVAEQDSYTEEPEWGAISDPAGYKALKSIDSYQSVQDGTKYPAVLLTTGVTDPRVAPFHVAKMTARLQSASTSGKPILLRVDFDAGHGFGSTRAQQDREAADTYAFLMWQLRPEAKAA